VTEGELTDDLCRLLREGLIVAAQDEIDDVVRVTVTARGRESIAEPVVEEVGV
jgi:hypothetical protein